MSLAPDQRPKPASIPDRYTRLAGEVYLTGIQALVRMVADRARVDSMAGLRTASFISGYEGSPLAGYDLEIARRRSILEPFDITHRPALNEELGATAVMGSQLAARVGNLAATDGGRRDGIVGYWYGKAPGLDRATDALRHANMVGTDPSGGAVALVGDDPGAKSSTIPCASEMALADLYMPTLYPADSQDVLDFGVHAALMSRSSGLWTAMKICASVADGASTAVVDLDRFTVNHGDLARSPHVPSGRLLGTSLMELEQNQLTIRKPRAVEYARLNGINRIVVRSADDRIGIVAAGKTYLDVREGLRLIGIKDGDLRQLGIRILKVGMIYPLERTILDEFVTGLDEVIVVEEKRDFLETMIRDILFDRARSARAPAVSGKVHEDGSTLFSRFGELTVDAVTLGLAQRLSRHAGIPAATAWLERRHRRPTRIELPLAARSPYFCSGCPHSSSTKVADGTLVGAGIGCHAMVLLMDPAQVGDVAGITQMGGEGAQWLGMEPFIEAKHFVQNLGDGTFAHSGSLALRAAVAAGANITYKILYNGTVAMTGGQDPVGDSGLADLVSLVLAEGVARVVVTTDDVRRTARLDLPTKVEIRHRDDTLAVQATLAAVSGVTVLVHDQFCAAEKRRGRKRGTVPTPATRVMINERLCEGCGDCGEKSNCLSVHPVDTEFGRKTRIDQSSCNVDYTCLRGDCPSFVTVTPGASGPAVRVVGDIDLAAVPDPERRPQRGNGFRARITGIGGTGVVTVSQILATAAVLDGHHPRTVDMTGLAQKGGAVVSDLKVSFDGNVEQAARIATGDCDLYLACDQLVGADAANIRVADPGFTVAVMSSSEVPTGSMVVDTAVTFPSRAAVIGVVEPASARTVILDAASAATRLFGDEQYANMIMVGAAYQSGALAISADAIEAAIAANGVATATNVQAFRRGRQLVADPTAVDDAIAAVHPRQPAAPVREAVRELVSVLGRLDDEIAQPILRRVDDLIAYQNANYARRYVEVIARVRAAELGWGGAALTLSVARNLYKLMAYKDEYEVARLSQDSTFAAEVADTFGEDATVAVRLHPPALRALGMRSKISVGRSGRPVLTALAAARRVRGTAFDPFGRTRMRRLERELIVEYIDLGDAIVEALDAGRLSTDVLPALQALTDLPDMVRGYEHIKLANVERYRDAMAAQRQQLGI